jgi:Enoyl-CoA hydratase/isomerase
MQFSNTSDSRSLGAAAAPLVSTASNTDEKRVPAKIGSMSTPKSKSVCADATPSIQVLALLLHFFVSSRRRVAWPRMSMCLRLRDVCTRTRCCEFARIPRGRRYESDQDSRFSSREKTVALCAARDLGAALSRIRGHVTAASSRPAMARFEVSERIMTITMDRPKQRNAFNNAMYEDLTAALNRAASDDSVLGVPTLALL